MLRPEVCLAFIGVFLVISLENKIVGAKTQFLSSPQQDYHLIISKLQQPLNTVPMQSQDSQFRTNGDKDVIHIIDPPVFWMNQKISNIDVHSPRTEYQNVNNWNHKPNQMIENNLLNNFEKHRPSAEFLIQPEPPNGNALQAPHQDFRKHNSRPQKIFKKTEKTPHKLGYFSNTLNVALPEGNLNYAITRLPQLYPFQVSAAVRHKEIIRKRPAPLVPHATKRVHTKKLKTFQSKMLHNISDFEEETDDRQLSVLQSKRRKTRTRRDVDSWKKSVMPMRGNLLPVALIIMGENGQLLTGRALLQHITVLLKNASVFEPMSEDDDINNFANSDVILNEKDFHHIMKNSMNLTDPVMLTVLGLNTLKNSSLLTNAYVNEYLNCMDTSKVINRFQALQTKIDCMKRKMFDGGHYDATGSSRYSIRDLPAALVYADVMSNIKKLVRPKNGIAFYSLPVDELTHLQQVVLPIEEYVSQIHNAHFAPRNNHNRKIYFSENNYPKMPVWYIVKPDGRIYQTEGSRNHPQTATIFHGFPDIPYADGYVERAPRTPFLESVFYED